MSKQARLGDIVNISCPHGATGIITTGSNYTYDRGKKVARLSDTVICCSCGKTGNIISGSQYTYADALKMAKVGDTCVGSCDVGAKCCPHSRTGTIVTGSDTTYTT